MKRTILIVLCLAAVGTLAVTQAHEDTQTPCCCNCEPVEDECCCGGTVDGCAEDCDICDECDCDSEHNDCSGDCDECDSECEDCTGDCDECDSEEKEEEDSHCGGCH